MEARLIRVVFVAAMLLVSLGASHRSPNFVVTARTPDLAARIAQASEKYRHDLAISWLGEAMPNWSAPCKMTVQVGPDLGAGGATTFVFDDGEVYGWQMSIQGSEQRIFDSVLPHEITHMIFASHFRQPLPRWADEGAATSVECASERARYRRMLQRFLRTGRGISFSRMFAMKEYPRDVMPLYAQGFTLAEFLLARGGRKRYVAYIEDGLNSGDWSAATRRHYGIDDLGTLQGQWLAWVGQGCPPVEAIASQDTGPTRLASLDAPRKPRDGAGPITNPARPAPEALAAGKRPRPEPNLIYHIPDKKSAVVAASHIAPANGLAPRRLPESGWQLAGAGASPAAKLVPVPPRPLASAPTRAVQPQLTRPQPPQQSSQIILEWRRR